MTAHTGSWIFATSSPRKRAVPTRCTSRPGFPDTNSREASLALGPHVLGHGGLRRGRFSWIGRRASVPWGHERPRRHFRRVPRVLVVGPSTTSRSPATRSTRAWPRTTPGFADRRRPRGVEARPYDGTGAPSPRATSSSPRCARTVARCSSAPTTPGSSGSTAMRWSRSGLRRAPGRDEWHAVGPPLNVRSMTSTADGGALLAQRPRRRDPAVDRRWRDLDADHRRRRRRPPGARASRASRRRCSPRRPSGCVGATTAARRGPLSPVSKPLVSPAKSSTRSTTATFVTGLGIGLPR